MTQDTEVDIVLGKALGVLGQTERGQPLRDRGHLLPSRFPRGAWHNDCTRQTVMIGGRLVFQGDLGVSPPGNALGRGLRELLKAHDSQESGDTLCQTRYLGAPDGEQKLENNQTVPDAARDK
jgi:hypothetical protein